MSETKHNQPDQYRGWLYKWTNYIKGYQKRWFVLQNGLLSYYRNMAEMAHTCRGTINLANAIIHTEDSTNFVISNGGTQSFHLKASSEVDRQKWVTALELAKAKAINLMESDEEDEETHSQPDKNELQNTLRTLTSKLEDLNTCNELIVKHGAALQRSLSELEQLDNPSDASSKIKSINERATLFRITSNAMINACAEYLDHAQAQGKRWQKTLQYEHEQRLRLEEMVEQLARQHSSFEKQARKSLAAASVGKMEGSHAQGLLQVIAGGPPLSEDEDDDFYDALEHNDMEEIKVTLPEKKKTHKRTGSGVSIDSLGRNLGQIDDYDSSETDSEAVEARVIMSKKRSSAKSRDSAKSQIRTPSQDSDKFKGEKGSESSGSGTPSTVSKFGNQPKRKRRTTIMEKPNYSINLWSIMKNCIGKDLSKIPMPVNFSEPLSMLQRLTEDFEYSECLDRAAQCEDDCEQLAYVAAFTISSYSTTTQRTGKPFNPLLGETFECDRTDDFGWRALAEQVSHHPPMAAQYTEGRGWTCWQEFTMSSKFRGKYLQIIPLGIAHLVFKKTGNHYTWRKVTTTVHNIIVGRLWVDNHGEMDILNHKTGDNCHLKYCAYSYFSRETPRKVTGVITDPNGTARYVLNGTWDVQMEGAPIVNSTESNKGKPVFETGPSKLLWKRRMLPPGSEKIYFFTSLAVQLNEPEDGVAPTDCRLRPDQRMMEDGQWEEANKEKVRLEEKQRAMRRKREQEAEKSAAEGKYCESYEPKWFTQQKDPQTGNMIHMYQGNYWDCKSRADWNSCPDIF
ncbi:oxysterol-binding protein 1-like isoform X2 [Lineus longissimus]|uniref:oxysterol-binding protein 1-like isoform X2 n=1 Tax=Lineus longissimus TaxID=88925 RepID=UPI002B4C95E3